MVKKQTTAKKWSPGNPQSDFINYELTKEDVAQLKKEFVPKFELAQAINLLCEEGLKITLRWDDRNDCGAAWLIPVEPDDPNAGHILSGRGSSPTSALIEVCFKHWVLFDKNWPKRQDSRKQSSWDE